MAYPTVPLDPWPPSNGLNSMIVPRKDIILAVHASARVAAPASLVASVLADASNYPSWNTFCPRVKIHSQSNKVASDVQHLLWDGSSFTFHVIMDSSKPNSVTDTRLRMTDTSEPSNQSPYVPRELLDNDGTWFKDRGKVFSFAWTTEGTFVSMGLKSERWHEIIELSKTECEVRAWECQGGPLARVVKFKFEKVLQRKFEQWCQDLKIESERRYGEGEE